MKKNFYIKHLKWLIRMKKKIDNDIAKKNLMSGGHDWKTYHAMKQVSKEYGIAINKMKSNKERTLRWMWTNQVDIKKEFNILEWLTNISISFLSLVVIGSAYNIIVVSWTLK